MEKTSNKVSRRKKVAFVLIAALVITAVIPVMSFAGNEKSVTFSDSHCRNGSSHDFTYSELQYDKKNNTVVLPTEDQVSFMVNAPCDCTKCKTHGDSNSSMKGLKHELVGWAKSENYNNGTPIKDMYFEPGVPINLDTEVDKKTLASHMQSGLKAIYKSTPVKSEDEGDKPVDPIKVKVVYHANHSSTLGAIAAGGTLGTDGSTYIYTVDNVEVDKSYIDLLDEDLFSSICNTDDKCTGNMFWNTGEASTGTNDITGQRISYVEGTDTYHVSGNWKHEEVPVITPDKEDKVRVVYNSNHYGNNHSMNQYKDIDNSITSKGGVIINTYTLKNLDTFICDEGDTNIFWSFDEDGNENIGSTGGSFDLNTVIDRFEKAGDGAYELNIYANWKAPEQELLTGSEMVMFRYHANHNDHEGNGLSSTGTQSYSVDMDTIEKSGYTLEAMTLFACAPHSNIFWSTTPNNAATAVTGTISGIDLLGMPYTEETIDEVTYKVFNLYGNWSLPEENIFEEPEGSVQGIQSFPGDSKSYTEREEGDVLGEKADPASNRTVLGEESKTGDTMNMVLIIFMILAAAAIAGGFMAQRKPESNKK